MRLMEFLEPPADVATEPAVPPSAAAAPPSRARRVWRALPDGLRFSLVVYLATRLVVLVGLLAWIVTPGKNHYLSAVLLKWDGWWYVRVAERGYSSSLRVPVDKLTDWHHQYSQWAFFPGYPLVVRVVREVTRLPYLATATVVALVFGLTATWAVYWLGHTYGGPSVARAAALLFAAWPGSAVLSQPYSEGLYLTAAAVGLALLLQRRWELAGLAIAVACATRPTGLGLVAAAGVVALERLWRHRDWRSLAAPAIGVLGAVAFAAYGWLRTGDPSAWRHAENLWRQRLDLSHKLLRTWYHLVIDPEKAMASDRSRGLVATMVVNWVGCAALLAFLVAAWYLRKRLTLAMAVYAVVTVALILAYSEVAPRPRTVLAVLPGFVWLAALWSPRRTMRVALWTAPLLAVVTFFWSWQVTP